MGHVAHMQTCDTPILVKLKTNANYKLPVDIKTKPGRNNPKGFFVFQGSGGWLSIYNLPSFIYGAEKCYM